ncbi:hypothetical protein PpBr36_04963 [Pyricularia pennisetigena]|uniref:hypothetical protein n=1 Tax=Pyricularia pennisetigena TaxID=1578925 RepID=UPI00114F9AD9|nr:hypothetical protein PpBr36_04963 [Pyricularia pennisetigena]TLS27128.1 hypothetical protein PpBr36_04963 [Pyricularia pennisetigena]
MPHRQEGQYEVMVIRDHLSSRETIDVDPHALFLQSASSTIKHQGSGLGTPCRSV